MTDEEKVGNLINELEKIGILIQRPRFTLNALNENSPSNFAKEVDDLDDILRRTKKVVRMLYGGDE